MALATACVVACSGGSEGVSGGAEVVSVLDGGDVRGDDLPAVPDAGPRVAPDQDAVVSDASEGEEDTGGPVYHPFCIKVCDAIATCDALPKSVCLERCSGGDACDVTCLEHSQTCAEAAECLGVWEPAQTFDPGPYGAVFRTTAGDVVVPTDAGEWSLSSHWNGRDMAVFFFTTNGFAYASALWQTGLQEWLEGSPRNVHYFFVSFTDSTGSDAGQKEVEAMRSRMDAVVGQLDPVRQCHWARRIHYATQPLQKIGGPLLAALAESGGQAVLGIDRTQKWRQIGLLQGRGHELATAVCAMQGGRRIWHQVEAPRLMMRQLAAADIEGYLDAAGDEVIGCVGGYRLEGVGIHLFTRIEGDYFSILGLPLLPLLEFLRGQGIGAWSS